MKPTLKYEAGVLTATASTSVDANKDGKASFEADVNVRMDASEVLKEIVEATPDERDNKLLPFALALVEKLSPKKKA